MAEGNLSAASSPLLTAFRLGLSPHTSVITAGCRPFITEEAGAFRHAGLTAACGSERACVAARTDAHKVACTQTLSKTQVSEHREHYRPVPP